MSAKENIDRLKAILKLVSDAKRLTQVAHEKGEYHLTPVFHQLSSCEQAVTARVYGLESFVKEEADREKQATLAAEESKRKEAEEKANAEKKAEADKAAADAEAARIERERILRTGTPAERLNVRDVNELKSIAAGMKIQGLKKTATKDELIEAILKAEKADAGEEELPPKAPEPPKLTGENQA